MHVNDISSHLHNDPSSSMISGSYKDIIHPQHSHKISTDNIIQMNMDSHMNYEK